MKYLAFLLTLLIALPALADSTKNIATRPNMGINAQTLASSRSFEVENLIQGSMGKVWGLLNIWVDILDADDGETGVSLTCTGSYDNNTTDYRIPACVWDSANTRYNCEAGPLFWNPSDETAADNKYQLFRVDIEGIEDIECTFAFTTGSATDTITARYSFAVKG